MNFISKFYSWIKTLPAPLQTFYYAVEASVIGGVTITVAHFISDATSTPPQPFVWATEISVLWLAVKIGIAKGLFDLLKSLGGAGPTQEPVSTTPAPVAAQPGATP